MMHHQAQINLLTQQLRTGQVLNEKVLHTYAHVPRSLFVPKKYKDFAYSDMQIPLEHGQIMLTPLEEGLILQHMNFLGHENVLEIGTGSGYFTALLSHFVKKIISVDVFSDLIHEAENKVQKFKACDIDFICQNAEYGLAEKAPFDAIIITCGMNNLSSQIKSQLKASGKIFYICGNSESMSGKIVTLDKTKNWQENFIFDTKVPMLITEKPEDSFVF